MAIIRSSPLVAGISGKLGGIVFAQGGRGATVRTMQRQVNSKTPYQLAARARMQELRQLWMQAPEAKRQMYAAIARNQSWPDALGQYRPPSPMTFYLWYLGILGAAGLGTSTPDVWWPTSPQPQNLEVIFGGIYEALLIWDGPTPPAGSYAMIYGARTFRTVPPTSPPTLPLLATVAITSTAAGLTGQLYDRQGPLETDEYVALQLRLIFDEQLPGALSNWVAGQSP